LRVEEPGAALKEVVRKADERFVAPGDNRCTGSSGSKMRAQVAFVTASLSAAR